MTLRNELNVRFSGDHRAIRSPKKKHSSSSSERKKWGRDRHDHGSKWDSRTMTTKKPGILQKIKNAIG
ncbi:hypothetical protein AAVH_12784 [Aphelenchoides avenae]|nr:hypothetical protein AAVH_12784 [Aphelenchus avenae]